MKHVIDVLREARELIADPKHHCEQAYGKSAAGFPTDPRFETCTQFCALGAVQRAAYGVFADVTMVTRESTRESAIEATELVQQATQLLHDCRDQRYACISDVNDLGGHEKALEMFDRAIEAAKGKECEVGGEG